MSSAPISRLCPPVQTTESTTATSALADKQLKNTVRGRFYKPIKRQITVRVDADVLDWLKSQRPALPIPHQHHPAAENSDFTQMTEDTLRRWPWQLFQVDARPPSGSGLRARVPAHGH